MPHPLDGARLKIARAKAHAKELDATVREYLVTLPVVVDTHNENEGELTRLTWTARTSAEPPQSIGVILGDCAHDARAALDYLVYELAKTNVGGEPENTQFPIVTDPGRYSRAIEQRLAGVPDWSLPIFEGLQPFNDPNGEPESHPLAILADVSNQDKHRLLHTSAMAFTGTQARLSGASLLEIHGMGQNPGPLTDGSRVIFETLVKLDGDDFEIDMHVETTVTLNDYDIPVAPLAEHLVFEVDAIVEWFAAGF